LKLADACEWYRCSTCKTAELATHGEAWDVELDNWL